MVYGNGIPCIILFSTGFTFSPVALSKLNSNQILATYSFGDFSPTSGSESLHAFLADVNSRIISSHFCSYLNKISISQSLASSLALGFPSDFFGISHSVELLLDDFAASGVLLKWNFTQSQFQQSDNFVFVQNSWRTTDFDILTVCDFRCGPQSSNSSCGTNFWCFGVCEFWRCFLFPVFEVQFQGQNELGLFLLLEFCTFPTSTGHQLFQPIHLRQFSCLTIFGTIPASKFRVSSETFLETRNWEISCR